MPSQKISRVAFRPKDQVLITYRTIYAALTESLHRYRDMYGEPFDPTDESIPDAHKYYYQLLGIQQLFNEDDRSVFDLIHAESIDPDTLQTVIGGIDAQESVDGESNSDDCS